MQQYYVEDNQFVKTFNFSNKIFATVIDKNHVKGITAVMIFPIVDLSKRNDRFSSSFIMDANLLEKDVLYAISKNKVLMISKSNLKELSLYLDGKDYLEEIIKERQESAKIKIKK